MFAWMTHKKTKYPSPQIDIFVIFDLWFFIVVVFLSLGAILCFWVEK